MFLKYRWVELLPELRYCFLRRSYSIVFQVFMGRWHLLPATRRTEPCTEQPLSQSSLLTLSCPEQMTQGRHPTAGDGRTCPQILGALPSLHFFGPSWQIRKSTATPVPRRT